MTALASAVTAIMPLMSAPLAWKCLVKRQACRGQLENLEILPEGPPA